MKKIAFSLLIAIAVSIQLAAQQLVLDPTFKTCGLKPINNSADIINDYMNSNCPDAQFHLNGKSLAFLSDGSESQKYGTFPCTFVSPPNPDPSSISIGLTNYVEGNYAPAILTSDLESSIQKGMCYTISYTALNALGEDCKDFFMDAKLEFGISDVIGDFGTSVGTSPILPTKWIKQTTSFIAPTDGKFLTVRLYNDPKNPESIVFIDEIYLELVECKALKLNLLSFDASVDANCYTNLVWKTAEEVDTDKFEIEQATDAKNFIKVATVTASSDFAGTTYTSKISQNIPLSYFRLKMIDKDGTFTYSQIVSVKNTCSAKVSNFTVYPNPVSANSDIKISSKIDATIEITIQNSNGQVIANYNTTIQKGGIYKLEMPSKFIGIGYITIIDQYGSVTKTKIVVQ